MTLIVQISEVVSKKEIKKTNFIFLHLKDKGSVTSLTIQVLKQAQPYGGDANLHTCTYRGMIIYTPANLQVVPSNLSAPNLFNFLVKSIESISTCFGVGLQCLSTACFGDIQTDGFSFPEFPFLELRLADI